MRSRVPAAPLALSLALPFALGGCDGLAARERPKPSTGVPPGALVYDHVVDGNRDVYAIPAGGGVARRLAAHAAEDMLPRWTHDGKALLFASERTGTWQIWEVDAEGGTPRRVRANGHCEWQVDESPDGRRLVFLSNAEGAEHLWVMKRDGGAARVVVRHGSGTVMGNPDWSPDGTRVVFSSNWRLGHHIYVADVAMGNAERMSPLLKGGCEPRFSPDGSKVVYVTRGGRSDRSRLVEHDLASGEQRVLVDWPALNYDPVYLPDGTELAFASNVAGEYAIYRQRLADGKSWRLTFGGGPARNPDYRPAR